MYYLSKFCRLCMKNDEILINFNSMHNDIIIFYHKFKTCVPEIIHDDTSINWLICETCTQNLTRSYEFRELCLSKDIIFKTYISQLKNSNLKNKPDEFKNLSVVIKNDPSLFNVDSHKNTNDFDFMTCIATVKIEPHNDPEYDEDAFHMEEILSVDNELYHLVKFEHSEEIENGNTAYCNELNTKDNYVKFSKKECSDYENTCSDAVNIEDINDFKIHNRSLAEATPAGCNENDERVKNESSLIIHEDLRSVEKPYTCDVCFRYFSQKSNHKKHMQIHTEKKYVCNMCNKGFNEIIGLEKHNRMHTGEKLHICDICNKSFYQISHLKGHRRTHTGEKPYECKVCSKTFSHKNAHTRHERIHTGEKPFFCDVCFKDFRDSGYLKVHKRIHSGEKPHVCEICNKRFNQAHRLKSHKKLHISK